MTTLIINFILSFEKNSSNVDILPSTLTRAEIKDMFEEEISFERLKDKYNLEIEDESELGTLYTICKNIPSIRFDFKKNNDSGLYEIIEIRAFASMLLPEYLGMTIDEIPIVWDVTGHDGNVIYMKDDYFRYSATITPQGELHPNDYVNIWKKETE